MSLEIKNIRTVTNEEITVLAADGILTDQAISDLPDATQRVKLYELEIMANNLNTVDLDIRVGFAVTSLPAPSLAGVKGMVASHPGLPAGSGFFGVAGTGPLGAALRVSANAPTTGSYRITFSYEITSQ